MFSANLPFSVNLNLVEQYPELFVGFAKANDCIDKNGLLTLQKALVLLNGRPHSADWHELQETVDRHNIKRKRIARGSRKSLPVKPVKRVNQAESVHVSYVNMKSY